MGNSIGTFTPNTVRALKFALDALPVMPPKLVDAQQVRLECFVLKTLFKAKQTHINTVQRRLD